MSGAFGGSAAFCMNGYRISRGWKVHLMTDRNHGSQILMILDKSIVKSLRFG